MLVMQPGAWHAAVDYLRMTHRPGPGLSEALYLYREALAVVSERETLPGYRPEPWAWMGYTGERLGSVSYGEGPNGAIVQASGGAAHELAMLRLPYTGVPRLDVQATYWLGADVPGLAGSVAELSVRARYARKGRPWAVQHINGTGAGDTCYIGTRGKRSKFLRVYDKWRQQGKADDWRNAWRFEAELTDDHAEYALGTLSDGRLGPHEVLGLLAAYFAERGVELPEVALGGYYAPSVAKAPPEDVQRSLRWLDEQVRPAIDKLLARGVSLAQVKGLLGLADDPDQLGDYRPL